MKKNIRDPDFQTMFLWPLVVCLLTVLFAGVSICSVQQLNNSVSMIYAHPFMVSQNVNSATNTVAQMQLNVRRLNNQHDEEEHQEIIAAVQELEKQLEGNLDYIQNYYTGDPQHVETLLATADKMLTLQHDVLIHIHEDTGLQDAINSELNQYYAQFTEDTKVIMDRAVSSVKKVDQNATNTSEINAVLACTMIVLIVWTTIYSRRTIQQKNRDLQNRDQLFSQLTNNIDDAVFVYAPEQKKMEFISENVERVLGMSKEKTMDSVYLRQLCVNEESWQVVHDTFMGEPLTEPVEREYQVHNPNTKQIQWMVLQVYPIFDSHKELRYIIKVVDRTQELKNRQDLQDALASAQKASNAKRDFLSRMSHEIRTPMNAIIGMTAIATANLDNRPKIEDCLEKISYSSQHLLSIINDVLDMSSIESGKLAIANESFDLSRLLTQTAAIYSGQCASRGSCFELTSDLTVERLIGDQLRVNQVLYNLLSNAVKFTPAGGTVHLNVTELERKDQRIRLRFSISDTGIGMKPEFLERIFEPFEQADATTAQKYGGTGLGMPITKNLVTMMGGTIQVKSTFGEGSTFHIELPFRLDSAAESDLPENTLRHLKTLVVDDDRGSCEHAALLLERMGMEVQWVTSGREAVNCVLSAHQSNQDYDVCFLDWKMPDMDGLETTRRIREQVGEDTLIIILSAYDWSHIETEAKEAGANAFVSKPLFPTTLYRTLSETTGRATDEPEPKAEDKQYDFHGKHILLVEDNELNMEIAKELLGSTGFTVSCACHGQEALDMFSQNPPGTYDLILMDVQMPIMDGYQATRAIRALDRADAKEIPIFAMTANAFHEDVVAAKEAGMNEHVAKPFDPAQLYEVLEKYLA